MNPRERVLKTLDHSEPDRVPYTEHLIENPRLAKRMNMGGGSGFNIDKLLQFASNIKDLDKRVNKFIPKFLRNPKVGSFFIKKFMGGYFNFYTHLGVDLGVFPIAPYSYFRYVRPNYIITEFGTINQLKTIGGKFSAYYVGGAIRSEKIYDNFPKLDPEQPLGFLLYDSIKRYLKNDDKIYAIPGIFSGLFDSISLALGIEYFSKILIKDQSFLKKIIADRVKFYMELIKKALDVTHTEVFMMGDDLAYNSGPFISPRFFNKFFLPGYKKISNMVHKRGVKLIFHTDGDIKPLLPGLLECFDSIHPLQASANIDIFQFKKDYGDKICLEGNVPISMLVHNTPQEISEYVKKLIKICAPGGGYMLSSGNSIVPEIPPKNYVAMLSAFRKYRNYPITID